MVHVCSCVYIAYVAHYILSISSSTLNLQTSVSRIQTSIHIWYGNLSITFSDQECEIVLLVSFFWYWLTQVALEERPLNE